MRKRYPQTKRQRVFSLNAASAVEAHLIAGLLKLKCFNKSQESPFCATKKFPSVTSRVLNSLSCVLFTDFI